MLHILTTGLVYKEGTGGPSMLQGWDILLRNILKSIGEPRVNIVHWCPEGFTEELKQQVSGLSDNIDNVFIDNVFIDNIFPQKKQELCNILDVAEIPKTHILIDMAHLVEYALDNEGGTYSGYDKEFLKQLNYIYLGFHTFIHGIPTNAPPLVFYATPQIIEQYLLKWTNSHWRSSSLEL